MLGRIRARPGRLLLRRAGIRLLPGREYDEAPATQPSYWISPAKNSGFIAMQSAIIPPMTKPMSVPAATPRQSIFRSPFVTSHLRSHTSKGYRRSVDQCPLSPMGRISAHCIGGVRPEAGIPSRQAKANQAF